MTSATADAEALRRGTRAAFEVLFPHLDYEREEREEFPNYQAARKIAAAILGISGAETDRAIVLDRDQVAFEIRYALQQAKAHQYLGAKGSNRLERDAALERLVDAVMARLASLRIERPIKAGSMRSPFEHIGQRGANRAALDGGPTLGQE
ncbi:hypothetical protein [Sphingomonas abietis]|uniref:Uncharacterized protein n=1 Tax=Sphingomonas abietis TaxID=3012344 RepID=A0ABY7NK48_9SPHN|nr:hypothetical protein [Sphingomonas abietis]WBO20977.1 hypothetical protein PBT88_12250 [Sphingomonas abietis]